MPQERFSLNKRRNGYFYAIYYQDNQRKWLSTGCKKQSDALQWLRQFKVKKVRRISDFTLTEYLATFLSERSHDLRSTTRSSYQQSVKSFTTVLGDRSISSYTSNDIETWKTKLLERISPITVNIYYKSLRAVFSFAVRREVISESPFTQTKKIKVPQREPVYFTIEDLQKLLSHVEPLSLREFFLFCSLTGMRVTEAINTKWQNVDFKRRQILITNTDSFTTKSGRIRVVPMHDSLVELLERKHKEKISQYVFSKSNGERFTRGYLTQRFKVYVRRAKLDERLHLHSLRHTFASLLVQSGVSLYAVKTLLGHSSITTTEIYSHMAPNTLLESVNQVRM